MKIRNSRRGRLRTQSAVFYFRRLFEGMTRYLLMSIGESIRGVTGLLSVEGMKKYDTIESIYERVACLESYSLSIYKSIRESAIDIADFWGKLKDNIPEI